MSRVFLALLLASCAPRTSLDSLANVQPPANIEAVHVTFDARFRTNASGQRKFGECRRIGASRIIVLHLGEIRQAYGATAPEWAREVIDHELEHAARTCTDADHRVGMR